jgi:hypothetical protein
VTYGAIWSLKRYREGATGNIWPPRPVDAASARWMDLDDECGEMRCQALKRERDPTLSMWEYQQEETRRGGYSRRKGAI